MEDEAAGSVEWLEPYAGFTYQAETIEVSAAYQADKLGTCGLDPGIFGGQIDPSFFIGLAIQAGIKSGISAEGNVNMLQNIQQHRPARLDEPLTVSGRITAVNPVPRGRTVHTSVTFSDGAGLPVITATRISLKPDPAKVGVRGAGDRPAPLVTDAGELRLCERYQLTPERVKAYSSEGNSIHYEQAAAEQAGFRAPLIGGGMGVHYLMAELWQQPPQTFAMDIYFRRPIFWDEMIQVGRMAPDANTRVLALLKPDAKVGTELSVNL